MPKYMLAKSLSDGSTAYFWNPPGMYRGMVNGPKPEALGKDFAKAVDRAEELFIALSRWRDSTPADIRKAMATRRVTLKRGKPQKVYGKGIVYIVETEDFIKVGFTRNLASRLAQINTCTPHQVKLVHSFPGTIQDEQQIHRALGDSRHKLEWFRKTESVLAYVEQLKTFRSAA